jgi:4-amino-4-deoxy-L-arabinose transferase-like glycosyltransferase
MKKHLQINNLIEKFILNHRAYFGLGIISLLAGLVSFVFLRINYLIPMVNRVRGHAVSEYGFRVINETYLAPVKLAFVLLGLVLISVGCFLKFEKYREKIILSITKAWKSLFRLRIRQILIALLVINLISKCVIMFFVPEEKLAADGAYYMTIARSVLRGEGYVTHSASMLVNAPSQLPYPVSDIPPLYPLLIFIFFGLFGTNFLSAIFINVILSALLPSLAFLLVFKITKEKKIALLTAILLSVNYVLVGFMTFQVARELLFACLVLVCFVFTYGSLEAGTKIKKNINLALAGVFLGLAFLARLELVVLMGPIIFLTLLWNSNIKKTLISMILILLAFIVIISPWLSRNYNLSGNPFGVELKSISISSLASYHDYETGVSSIDFSGTDSELLKINFVSAVKQTLIKFFYYVLRTPTELIGSIVIFLFAIAGIFLKRKEKRFWPIILFIAIGYIFYPFFSGEIRHLQYLIPFFLMFAAIGIFKTLETISGNKKRLMVYFLTLVLFFTVVFGIVSATRLSISDGQSIMTAKRVSEILKLEMESIKTVMYSSHADFLSYWLKDKNTIAFPSKNIDALEDIIKIYNVNYIVFVREKDINDSISIKLGFLGARLIHFSQPDSNTELRIYKL